MIERLKRVSFSKIIILTFISWIVFLLYTSLSKNWVKCGGYRATLLLEEFPLFLSIYLVLYFPEPPSLSLSEKKLSIYMLLPSFTLLGFYSVCDVFYAFLHRSLRISDIANALLVKYFDVWLLLVEILALLIISFPVFLILMRWWFDTRSLRKTIKVALFKLAMLSVIFLLATSDVAYVYQSKVMKFVCWTDYKNIKKYGRIVSVLYHLRLREKSLEKLRKYSGGLCKSENIDKILWPGIVKRKRDVVFVVLESFLCPMWVSNVKFSRPPLYCELKKYMLEHSRFSVVFSPVYGGGTAQSEFELLVGVPAYSLIDSIEFNALDGYPINSFVRALKRNGYFTFAVVGTGPEYFNSVSAYTSIGFDKVFYIYKKSSVCPFIKGKDRKIVFDGDLFRCALELYDKMKGVVHKPIFLYVLGMYGHLPYKRNYEKRPDVLEVIGVGKDEPIYKISNQFYYRTKALYEFLSKLKVINKDAVVLIISDHIPPMSKLKYRYDLKSNIALLLDGFKPIDISGLRYYQIPHFVWRLLGGDVGDLKEGKLKTYYYCIMAKGTGLYKN